MLVMSHDLLSCVCVPVGECQDPSQTLAGEKSQRREQLPGVLEMRRCVITRLMLFAGALPVLILHIRSFSSNKTLEVDPQHRQGTRIQQQLLVKQH